MMIAPRLQTEITPSGADYETVSRVVALITEDYRDQPSLEAIAAALGQSPTQLQKTFTRWAGLSPKRSCRPSPSITPSGSWRGRSAACSKPAWSSAFPAPAACMISS